MYIICWFEEGRVWDQISGEDAMQVFVSELCERLELDPEDIYVFPVEKEI